MAHQQTATVLPFPKGEKALTMDDSALPANCFTLHGGRIEEGVRISLKDPFGAYSPALVLGKRSYMRRDNKDGCFFREHEDGESAIVRRADVRADVSGRGGCFHLLCALRGESVDTILMRISVSGCDVPDEKRMWRGVETSGGKIQYKGEAFVWLSDGQDVRVFYKDGSVFRIVFENGEIASGWLPYPCLLEERFIVLRGKLRGIDDVDEKTRGVREYWVMSELARLLEKTGKDPACRKKVVEFAISLSIPFRGNMVRKFFTILQPYKKDTTARRALRKHLGRMASGRDKNPKK
jgi:hypothetical protein